MKREWVTAAGWVWVAAVAVAVGCGSGEGRMSGVEVVASGRPPISYRVSGPGTVWVRDVTTGGIAHSGKYLAGETPLLVEVSDEVTLKRMDGAEMTVVQSVNEEDWYEVWFKAEEGGRGGATKATTRGVE